MHTALIIGGLAAAGVVAYVLYRQATEKPASSCDTIAAKLAQAGASYYTAGQKKLTEEECRKASALGDIVGGLLQTWASKDAENKRLNGAVELALTSEVRGLTGQLHINVASGMSYTGGGTPAPTTVDQAKMYIVTELLHGTVLRFANGGVPFKAHPDFVKCAPGTHDMTAPGNPLHRFWRVPPGAALPSSKALYEAMNGKPTGLNAAGGAVALLTGDVVSGWAASAATSAQTPVELALRKVGVSFRFAPRISDMFRGSNNDPTTSMQAGIVAGVKHQCPAGQVLIEVIPLTDHRADGSVTTAVIKRCAAPGTAPTKAPPVGGAGTTTAYVGQPGSPPPGFHWVQTPAPAHWERNR